MYTCVWHGQLHAWWQKPLLIIHAPFLFMSGGRQAKLLSERTSVLSTWWNTSGAELFLRQKIFNIDRSMIEHTCTKAVLPRAVEHIRAWGLDMHFGLAYPLKDAQPGKRIGANYFSWWAVCLATGPQLLNCLDAIRVSFTWWRKNCIPAS